MLEAIFFYCLMVFLAFLAFIFVTYQRGWLMRLVALPLILLPLVYVFLFFSQNFADGHNDAILTHYMRLNASQAALDKYNAFADGLFTASSQLQGLTNPILLNLFLLFVLFFVAVKNPNIKRLSGKKVSRTRKFLEIILFLICAYGVGYYLTTRIDPYGGGDVFWAKTHIKTYQDKADARQDYLTDLYFAFGSPPKMETILSDFDRSITRNIDNPSRITEPQELQRELTGYSFSQLYRFKFNLGHDEIVTPLLTAYIDEIIEAMPQINAMYKATLEAGTPENSAYIKQNYKSLRDEIIKLAQMENNIRQKLATALNQSSIAVSTKTDDAAQKARLLLIASIANLRNISFQAKQGDAQATAAFSQAAIDFKSANKNWMEQLTKANLNQCEYSEAHVKSFTTGVEWELDKISGKRDLATRYNALFSNDTALVRQLSIEKCQGNSTKN